LAAILENKTVTIKRLMEYQQYKTTALKHLQTCEYIMANLSSERLNKLRVLRNVYYLSGYTFEGLINFWIFELLKRQGLLANPNNVYSYSNYPITIGSGKKLAFAQNKLNPVSFWLSQHDFQTNANVFQYLADGNSLSIVPLISDRTNEPYPKMLSLFDNWNVKVRYQNHPIGFPYQQHSVSPASLFQTTFETDISNFVKTARLVYDVLEDIQFGRTPRI
jgi:hypothetical protein